MMRTVDKDHMRTNELRLLPDLSGPESSEPIPAASSLELLKAIYSDPHQPMHRRMRAAIAALPFEHPKLSVIASASEPAGFGARLEAAIRRAEATKRKVIEGELTQQPDDTRVANDARESFDLSY